ncbi:MAG: endopeptidase La [Chlamydiia bacterium]
MDAEQDLTGLEQTIVKALEQGDEPRLSDGQPKDLYVVPLLRRPFFPGMAAPLVVEPGPYYDVLKQVANTSSKTLALFLTNKEDQDLSGLTGSDLYRVGVMARILRILPMPQGGAQVILSMEKRVEIERFMRTKALKVRVRYHQEAAGKPSKEIKAYAISILSTIKELLTLNPLFKEELQVFLGHSDFTDPGRLADFAVALTTASREELQDVLSTFDLRQRLEKALILLKKELDISRLQSSINQKIEGSIVKTQREFFLREQLKTIKRELGLEKDDKQADIDRFLARMKDKTASSEVSRVIREEVDKLQVLDQASSEYAVARNYLDWLTVMPWGQTTQDQYDLKHAEMILERDHYGLEDIKERILEFISVGKLSGGTKGSIICLVGPPGVGKTSIGKSIAEALGRKFYRFSVGGMRDESEIKGHRRTYVGAMPGKLVQAMKVCQTMNPVIMLDEIDKLAQGMQGDPASALLEVLDPEQNKDFLDHYLDVPVDLSQVLFITTANVLETIPEPLKDRMDIMRLSGYIQEEKVEIAKRYLIPRARKDTGLTTKQVIIQPSAIKAMIHGYAREAGVRTLDNTIRKVMRKVALDTVKSEQRHKRKKPREVEKVSSTNLEHYLGKPIYTSDRIYETTPIGVVTGLAWTALGGAILYVEAVRVPGDKPSLKLTGQLGEVIRESAEIAWTYAHSKINEYARQATWFKGYEVHMHLPEGSVPKDGPSAGIAMITALISLLLEEPVREAVSMTGEVTLTGKILPIGGLKEKLIAARRANCTILIFPKDNLRDYEELPEYLKEGLDVHFVEQYEEVYRIAFGRKPVRPLV